MNLHIRRLAARAVALVMPCAILAGPNSVSASIIDTTGSAHLISAPTSVEVGALENNHRTQVFSEQQGVTLAGNLHVDITTAGIYASPQDCTPGTLEAGMTVSSYLIHQDAIGHRGYILLHGSVTFDEAIVGVMVESDTLDASDAILGSPDTLYPTGSAPLRHLDFPQAADRITISQDMHTIVYDLQTQVALDHIRILTAPATVPGPGSLALLVVAGLTALSRRRRA